MHNLKLFSPSSANIEIAGDIQFQGDSLQISFAIDDPNTEIVFLPKVIRSQTPTNRAHQLWQETCFETFWSQPLQKTYWEFNLAPNGLWNIYYFNSYRSPQPIQESFDFNLLQFDFTEKMIHAVLECKIPLTSVDASLTAIIKTKSNQTLYFATDHIGKKPDFHLRESFLIKRSKTQ